MYPITTLITISQILRALPYMPCPTSLAILGLEHSLWAPNAHPRYHFSRSIIAIGIIYSRALGKERGNPRCRNHRQVCAATTGGQIAVFVIYLCTHTSVLSPSMCTVHMRRRNRQVRPVCLLMDSGRNPSDSKTALRFALRRVDERGKRTR